MGVKALISGRTFFLFATSLNFSREGGGRFFKATKVWERESKEGEGKREGEGEKGRESEKGKGKERRRRKDEREGEMGSEKEGRRRREREKIIRKNGEKKG